MIRRSIQTRLLDKISINTSASLHQKMQEVLKSNLVAEQEFLSPKMRPDGRYVTSEDTLDKSIDPRIFRETQIKRFCRFLATRPPVLKIFFNWLFVKKMKMKLEYFSENETINIDAIYKQGEKYRIEKQVTEGFKIHNLGHAVQLIQTEGLAILTDPVFTDLAPIVYPSMTKKFGLDVQVKDLPKIDAILISHNHRDHVDATSLKAVMKLYQPQMFVPKGDKEFFEKLGFKHVHELEWHEEVTLKSEITGKKVSLVSVPADHRSGRNGYDIHRSLVTGWALSPKSRNEILYFAGDTARLSATRVLAVALDIYALYKHKKALVSNQLPKIISMSPGGPNYTRKDMRPTHQSAVDSMIAPFRLAIALKKISKSDGKGITANEWLNATSTVFMHHNRFELGPDRFNENVFIYNRFCSYLNMDTTTLKKHKATQEAKSSSWSLFHRRKDFIIEGVEELHSLAKKIWPSASEEVRKKNTIQFIQARTHFPLINEKMTSEEVDQFNYGESSTFKPATQRGMKKS